MYIKAAIMAVTYTEKNLYKDIEKNLYKELCTK